MVKMSCVILLKLLKLSGIMASELGENAALGPSCWIPSRHWKAIDREVEGSHVEIGTELARKYKEHPVVVNTIASHHGDVKLKVSLQLSLLQQMPLVQPSRRS